METVKISGMVVARCSSVNFCEVCKQAGGNNIETNGFGATYKNQVGAWCLSSNKGWCIFFKIKSVKGTEIDFN